MKLAIDTQRKACTMVITVETASKQAIHLRVRDAYKPFTAYMDRSGFVNGKREFKIMMPLSPTTSIIEVYNEKVGNRAEGVDRTFTVSSKKLLPLQTKYNCFDTTNKTLLSFIRFAQEFSEQAAIISDNQSIYMSNDGRFRVDYFDVIRDSDRMIPNRNGTALMPNPKFGQPLKTPARISHKDGRIELSKNQFKKYTVPMRFVILLHEFSHFYLNRDINDETEADLNAVLVAMCIGMPRVEIHKAFIEIFKNTPTDMNRKRLEKIIFFINNFEKFNLKVA